MSAAPGMPDVMRFRALIARRLGLDFDESKLGKLAALLGARCGADCQHYLGTLEAAPSPCEELYRLAVELTVTETYFFRNVDQIRAYAEIALAERGAALDPGLPVRVLSAGCASGEEPYTLAIAAREAGALAAGRVAITAIDANPAMLARAARARYSSWSLRELSADARQRWFAPDGDAFVLDPAIRRAVRFEQRNLAEEGADFWLAASFDIVFCRNVLMYFTPAQAAAAVERIAHALVPGGYLFLGHAETLRGLSNDFHLCHTHGTFYYRRKEQAGAPRPAMPRQVAAAAAAAAPALDDTAWIGVIDGAARRIRALSIPAPAAAADSARALPDLHRALECLHQEQFGLTLEQIGGLAPEHAGDPDVLLLKAVSLSQSGALAEAEAVCAQLLAGDELSAGAHYVLGLCREGAGDARGAIAHYQSAAYLAPDFAMPRLHIGLLQRRQGERDAARHDLAQALALLHNEDPARILLFGGGFKREALLALCRAELAAFGEFA